jgi:hypothetical protein
MTVFEGREPDANAGVKAWRLGQIGPLTLPRCVPDAARGIFLLL